MKIVDLFVGRTINQLPVFDECTRHKEMETFCVMTSILVIAYILRHILVVRASQGSGNS